jgi:phage regulator Rha-like protein
MEETNLIIDLKNIEKRIFTIRGKQVMIDRDLAELYAVQTKRINEQMKRNINRFPIRFCFQLSVNELNELVAKCDRFYKLKHSTSLPYAFTEQGVAMLSAVLKSEIAVNVSIQIIDAFVEMRKVLNQNNLIDFRIDKLERKQLETDEKFDKLFKALENEELKPEAGIFFDGQFFDAYSFISEIIRKADKSIILIDNYIDDSVLTLLSKRKPDVKIIIYTKTISNQLKLDSVKFNSQFNNLEVKLLTEAHDRFLIIDEQELYHIGASLKDLGKKWFAFSKMHSECWKVLSKLK